MNRVHRGIVAVCASILVVGSLPTAGLAYTPAQKQAQLDQAEAQLNQLYADTEAVSSALNKTLDDLAVTQTNIDDISSQIEIEQEELVGAQAVLRQTIAANYKEGRTNLLSLVLNSSSIEDLVSRVYYANKVSETYNQQIRTVRDIQDDLTQQKASLEEQKSSLEQLRDDQEAQKTQLQASAAQAESYVAGLSAELREALAAETAAKAEAARAEAEATLEAAGGSTQTGVADVQDDAQTTVDSSKTETKPSNNQQQERPATVEEQEKEPEQKPEEQQQPEEPAEEEQQPEQEEPQEPEEDTMGDSGEAASPSSGLSNMAARTSVVNYVLAQVGKAYVWATHGPDTFDCSGLTGAAYDSIGYFVGYSDSYQEQFCNKPASEAVYGDIVWRPGHVGLCIGGGVTVEAHNPAAGIGYGSIYNFQRSGSPLG